MKIQLKEKVLLLEKDFRKKIIDTFKVPSSIADFAHNINDKLSIWIVDKLITQIIKERHFTRNQVIDFLNSSDTDLENYLQLFQEKVVSILDYYANPEGKQEYSDFDKFKKEDFDVLYQKSSEWHTSLTSRSSKSVEIKDTEPDIEIIKEYPPKQNGEIFYWADLHKKYSSIESSRMGHCGNTTKGDTLLSLRSFYPNADETYTNKSHITLSLNRRYKYYTQCKGKQNRKPAVQYREYIFDLFILDNDIQGYESEYSSGNDFQISDFSVAQLFRLNQIRPKLVEKYISKFYLKFLEDIKNISPKELYEKYILNLDNEFIKEFGLYLTNVRHAQKTYQAVYQIVNAVMPYIIKEDSLVNGIITNFFNLKEIDFNENNNTTYIQSAITDYCVFTNNFNKIKPVFEKYSQSEYYNDNNILHCVCFYAEEYPDYVIPYAYKLIKPYLDFLIETKGDDFSLFSLKEGKLEIYEIAKKFMEKNKDIYIDILYVSYIENIQDIIDNSDVNILEDYIKSNYQSEYNDIFNNFMAKIKEANTKLKDTPAYSKFRQELINIVFGEHYFTDTPILRMYYLDKDLIEYSLLADYNSNYLDEDIELQIDIFDNYAKFVGDRYGHEFESFKNVLEDSYSGDYPDKSASDYSDFFKYVEADPTKKTYIERELVDETESESYENLITEYKQEKNTKETPSLYKMFKFLNDNDRIPDFLERVNRAFDESYEATYHDMVYKGCKDAVEKFIEMSPFILVEYDLYEDKVTFKSSVSNIIQEFNNNYGDYPLDRTNSLSLESLMEGIITLNCQNTNKRIFVKIDDAYGYFDNDIIWDSF